MTHIMDSLLMWELNRILIHSQCVKWSAGISFPLSVKSMLVDWLIFFWGLILWRQERTFICAYTTKEKEHHNTRQSDLCSPLVQIRLSRVSMLFLLHVSCFNTFVMKQKHFGILVPWKTIECFCKYLWDRLTIIISLTCVEYHLFSVQTIL
jgi:hypothetical protein